MNGHGNTDNKIEKKDDQAARARAIKISPVSFDESYCATKGKKVQQVEADWPQVARQWRRWSGRRHCHCRRRRRHANAHHKEKQSSASAHCQAGRRVGCYCCGPPALAARDERRQELSSRIISIELARRAGAAITTTTAAHATRAHANGTRDLTDDKIVCVPARVEPRHAPFAMPEKDRRKGRGVGGLKSPCNQLAATRMDTKFLYPLLSSLSLFTLFLVTIFVVPAMDCYQVTADPGRLLPRRPGPIEPVRPSFGVRDQEPRQRHRWPHRRSLFGGDPSDPAPASVQGQDIVPYQTYYVTQACEWKSNLFVPKSNDILFAQPVRAVAQLTADQRQQRQQQQQQVPEESSSGLLEDASSSRTIFSTTNKALILALPPISHTTFAGYEPACSIRLIVPRNMRILAKLTARRLTFEQELLAGSGQLEPTLVAPLGFGASGGETAASAGGQLWLNVSQNQFSETEQKIIETEGNVLAFRFLLERLASLREPDIRLQVVLTAFQTWGENSDTGQPPGQSGDQLICDSGRLISANLACDGFRNCLDGQDEEPASCAALRQQQQQQQSPTPHLSSFNQTKPSTGTGGPSNRWAPVRVLNWITRDASPPVALLAGLLLLLLLLFCCTCCCYCLMLLVRKATANVRDDSDTSRRRVRRRLAALKLLDADGGGQAGRDGEDLETDSLARGQNLENAARLKAAKGLLEGGGGGASTSLQKQQQQQPLVAGQVRQIQSILKRPMASAGQQLPTSVSYKGVAPLARFESIPALGDPPPPPPRASAANRKLTTGTQQQPSPRRGALADSLTSARLSGRSFPDFRPTPATRAGGKREQPAAAGSLRSQPSSSGAPQVGVAQPVRPSTSSAGGREGPHGAHQQQRQASAGNVDETTSGFALESRTTKLEQTSTSTGNGERVTVYQYSSNLAQYSESYLLREQPSGAALLVTGARVAPSTSTAANDNLSKEDDDEAPELPPKSRQSSLI